MLPTYARHKFDGLLITNLLYPVTRALYGLRIREPYASEFAFSSRMGSQFLAQNSWNDESARAGCEVRFTLAAIAGGLPHRPILPGHQESCRAARRRSGARSAANDWRVVLVDGIQFFVVEQQDWIPADSYHRGRAGIYSSEPQRVNRKRLHEMFRSGVAELESVFHSILSPATLAELAGDRRFGGRRFLLLRGIVGKDSLRVCCGASQGSHQPGPYYSGACAAIPGARAHIPAGEPATLPQPKWKRTSRGYVWSSSA